MLAKAFENAKNKGHIMRTIHADWRWLNRDVHGKYDAIICLGNSFTLFDENDRRKTLAEFYAALKHDGILILDQRNYDSILDNGFSLESISTITAETKLLPNPNTWTKVWPGSGITLRMATSFT